MKIPVRDEHQSALGATAVKIKDLNSGLQKITVRAIKKRIRIPVKHASEDKPKTHVTATEEQAALQTAPTIKQVSPEASVQAKKKKRTLPLLLPLFKATTSAIKKVRRPVSVAGIVMLVAVAGIYFTTAPATTEVSGGDNTSDSSAATLEYGTPSFTTILPKDKDIEQLGGWVRVSPPDKEEVYAFTDTLKGVGIAVSQQQLPEDFSESPAENLKQVASEFGATEKITVEGATVHIGTSVKGPQSVIFTKKDLLVLIKSADPIDKKQWTAYIASLQ